MKAIKFSIFAAIIFFASNIVMAQESITTPPKETTLPDTTMKEYVSMQAGQMIIVQNNKTKKMDQDMTMSDGTVVKTNGTVITKDGKKLELHEGDKVYMNGKIDIAVKANVG